jgi:hypothetical protein
MIWLGVHKKTEHTIYTDHFEFLMPGMITSILLVGFNTHITSLVIILSLILPTVVVLPLPLRASILLLQLSMQVHICNAFSICAWIFDSLCRIYVGPSLEAERTHNGK